MMSAHYQEQVRTQRVRQLYLTLLKSPEKVEDAARIVTALKANDKKRLASDHLIRVYTHKAAHPSRQCRRVFNDEVHCIRTESDLNVALETCLGHFGTDTRELSEIRVRAAAIRAILYQEAQRMQSEEEARIRLAQTAGNSAPPGGVTGANHASKPVKQPIASEASLRWALESHDLNDIVARIQKAGS